MKSQPVAEAADPQLLGVVLVGMEGEAVGDSFAPHQGHFSSGTGGRFVLALLEVRGP